MEAKAFARLAVSQAAASGDAPLVSPRPSDAAAAAARALPPTPPPAAAITVPPTPTTDDSAAGGGPSDGVASDAALDRIGRDIEALERSVGACGRSLAGAHRSLAAAVAAAVEASAGATRQHAQALWQCAAFAESGVGASVAAAAALVENVRQVSASMRRVGPLRDDIARCHAAMDGLEALLDAEEAAAGVAKPTRRFFA